MKYKVETEFEDDLGIVYVVYDEDKNVIYRTRSIVVAMSYLTIRGESR